MLTNTTNTKASTKTFAHSTKKANTSAFVNLSNVARNERASARTTTLVDVERVTQQRAELYNTITRDVVTYQVNDHDHRERLMLTDKRATTYYNVLNLVTFNNKVQALVDLYVVAFNLVLVDVKRVNLNHYKHVEINTSTLYSGKRYNKRASKQAQDKIVKRAYKQYNKAIQNEYKANKVTSKTQNNERDNNASKYDVNNVDEYGALFDNDDLYALTVKALREKYNNKYDLRKIALAIKREYTKTHCIVNTCNELTYYALVMARKYGLDIESAHDYAQDLYLQLVTEYNKNYAWYSVAKMLVKKYVSNSIQATKTVLYMSNEEIDALAIQDINGDFSKDFDDLTSAEKIARNNELTDKRAQDVEKYFKATGYKKPCKVYSKAQASAIRQNTKARAQALAEIRENSQKFLDTQSAEYKRLFRAIDKNLSKAQAQRVKNLVKYLNKGYSANLIKQKAHTDKRTINKDLQALASAIALCDFDITKATGLYKDIERAQNNA